jgi:secretion/DNA translocation related CpaE-like protein
MPARADDITRSRPLLVTDDPHLLDELLNLAGADVEVAPDPAAARDRYGSAPIVLVGVDLAEACAKARLPRRPGVIVVGMRPDTVDPPEPPWALAERLGAEHIVLLPRAASWLADRLAMAAGTGPGGCVLAVVGGRGGAGASVMAAGLAVTAVRMGRRAVLVDGDPYGGGLDLVLGWEGSAGLRWPGLAHAAGGVSVGALAEALPHDGELAVLSCDRDDPVVPLEAMEAALEAGRCGWHLTVIDLPRRFDQSGEAALAAADHVLLVVPAELRACAAASRVAAEALRHTQSLSIVVRTPAPGRLAAREIARALELPLAGSYRFEPGLARDLEHGQPPAALGTGSLAQVCERLLAGFGVVERAAGRAARAGGAAAGGAAAAGGVAALGGAA